MELRCKVGPSEWPIRGTDLLRLLNPRPLNRVVPKNTIIHVTVFDPDILQGLRNFCRRDWSWIVLIHKLSVQSQNQMSLKLTFVQQERSKSTKVILRQILA